MIHQDKNKYNARKYRLVVRLTNTRVICQIAYATIVGDRTICQANSGELAKYGIPCGLKNYAACYATGLLVARRCLKQLGMDGDFKGKEEIDGDEYHVEEEETEAERRPFKAILDVGIRRTCEGARIWGALKGAADGGLHVPHKAKIFGEHVKEYMESMKEEDPTKYEAHFSKYIAASIDADGMEDMYTNAHKKIREDLSAAAKNPKGTQWTRDGNTVTGDGKSVER